MGAAARIAESSDIRVIGIPKTIDNDLTHTDHTPGYATAARFFACAARDIAADNRALPGQVEFIEVLGRNTRLAGRRHRPRAARSRRRPAPDLPA